MGKKEAVPNRRYTEEFKTEAVRLALSPASTSLTGSKASTIIDASTRRSRIRSGTHEIVAHGCVAWCTSNRGRVRVIDARVRLDALTRKAENQESP
jgi:transposase-like protein